MQRWCLAGLSCVVVFVSTGRLEARSPPPPPYHLRVSGAACVIVGKVTSVEEKPADGKPYRIAVVQVVEPLAGAKGMKDVRMAFYTRRPTDYRPGRMAVYTPAVGQEGIFILNQYPGQPTYQSPNPWNFIAKTNPSYDLHLVITKRILKLRADPAAGLQSKSAEDRLMAAVMLVFRYRAQAPGPNAQEEPIDAKQSKAILLALAEVPWNRAYDVSFLTIFKMLGLTPQDGWTSPQSKPNQTWGEFYADWEAAAKKWSADHAGTYRIKRWVAAKPAK